MKFVINNTCWPDDHQYDHCPYELLGNTQFVEFITEYDAKEKISKKKCLEKIKNNNKNNCYKRCN